MSHQSSLLTLVSDPTEDLMDAVVHAAWADSPDIAGAATKALAAIEGGAMLEPRGHFRHIPLHVVIMGWNRGGDYRQAMLPVFNNLVDGASQQVLNEALDLALGTDDIRQCTSLGKRLQQRGAQPSDRGLQILGGRLLDNDAARADASSARTVSLLADFGWQPSDNMACRKFLSHVIEYKATKTLDAFVSIYEKAQTLLPRRAGEDAVSPICMIYQRQIELKGKHERQHERYNEMIARMLQSGLVVCEEGVHLDWRKNAAPWVLEAEADGAARRLDRNTAPGPAGARPGRRM